MPNDEEKGLGTKPEEKDLRTNPKGLNHFIW